MGERVYCGKCKFLIEGEGSPECGYEQNIIYIHTPMKKVPNYISSFENINKNNSCGWFKKKKRGLINFLIMGGVICIHSEIL